MVKRRFRNGIRKAVVLFTVCAVALTSTACNSGMFTIKDVTGVAVDNPDDYTVVQKEFESFLHD